MRWIINLYISWDVVAQLLLFSCSLYSFYYYWSYFTHNFFSPCAFIIIVVINFFCTSFFLCFFEVLFRLSFSLKFILKSLPRWIWLLCSLWWRWKMEQGSTGRRRSFLTWNQDERAIDTLFCSKISKEEFLKKSFPNEFLVKHMRKSLAVPLGYLITSIIDKRFVIKKIPEKKYLIVHLLLFLS